MEASRAGVRRPASVSAAAGTQRRPPPWHPAFVHFPLACWVLAASLDAVALAGVPPLPAAWNLPAPAAIASLLLWLGLVAAVPAIAFGLVDFARLPAAARDSGEMLRHVAWMGGAASLFLIAALLRAADAGLAYLTAIEALGTVFLVLGGHAAAVVVFDRLPRALADDRSPDRTAPPRQRLTPRRREPR